MPLVHPRLPSLCAAALTLLGLFALCAQGAVPSTPHPLLVAGPILAGSLLLLLFVRRDRRLRALLLARLRLSEQRFRGMAEQSGGGLLLFNAAGWLIYANSAWADLTGATLSFGNGRQWLDAFAPADRQLVTAAWAHLLGAGMPFEASLAFRRADGGSGTGLLSLAAERGPSGAVTHVIVRLIDQTARVRAEGALAEREKLYRLLADHGRDLVLRLSPHGLILFAGQAAARLTGIAPERLLGHPLLWLVHPDDWTALSARLQAAVAPDSPLVFRLRRGRDLFFWVEALIDPGSAPGEWVLCLRDISVRRAAEHSRSEAERKLRETNRLLTLAEGLASIGHFNAAAASREVFFSPEACAVLGADAPSCSFAEAVALIDPADRPRLLRALVRSAREPGSGECQLRLAATVPSAPQRTIMLRLQAERRADGSLAALFGVVTDISARLAADRTLHAALDQARSAAEAKAAFLATMSHEIRTPMTGVLGMIELLRTDCPPAERATYLDTLAQSADLLMTVLNDILEFSRLDSGHLELSEQPFDLHDALLTTVRLFETTAAAKKLRLRLDWRAAGDSRVVGDRIRLQQVVSNLVSNAIKFTDRGTITVAVTARAAKRGQRRWRIAVRDRGIGIAPSDQARLFEPFVQAERGATRRFGGTGLGLAISRRLAEGMGGCLKLRSAPGAGSTFWLELLLAAAPPAPRRLPGRKTGSSPPRPPAPARPLDILLAEDNRVNQLLVTTLLHRLGHRVTCAADGLAAVDLAATRAFDCILMDMQMPGLDGLAAARAIRRSDGPSRATPIVALTADASPQRRLVYAVAEIDAFLAKPVDSAALAAVLGNVVVHSPAPPVATPAAVPDPAPDPLDHAQLGELRQVLGPARIGQLLGLFGQELAGRPAAIRAALGRSDLAAAAAEAHSLKGAALSIGGRAVGEAAAEVEQALGPTGAPHQAERLHEALRALDQAVAATIAALPAELALLAPRAA